MCVLFIARLDEDEFMKPFNVYIQTLLSEALEPGFLATIHQQDGGCVAGCVWDTPACVPPW